MSFYFCYGVVVVIQDAAEVLKVNGRLSTVLWKKVKLQKRQVYFDIYCLRSQKKYQLLKQILRQQFK